MRIFGGDEEDRTLDLTDANRTLSQLSYAPEYIVLNDCRRTDRREIPFRPTFCGAAAAHDGMYQPCGYRFEQMLLYHILLKKSTVISPIFNGEGQTGGDCSL